MRPGKSKHLYRTRAVCHVTMLTAPTQATDYMQMDLVRGKIIVSFLHA